MFSLSLYGRHNSLSLSYHTKQEIGVKNACQKIIIFWVTFNQTLLHDSMPNQSTCEWCLGCQHTSSNCTNHKWTDSFPRLVHATARWCLELEITSTCISDTFVFFPIEQCAIILDRAVLQEIYEPKADWGRCLIRPFEYGTQVAMN